MNDAPGIAMDIAAVMHQLPHRYPFLLIDRVLECVPGKSVTALKNVTINEPFFPGHFPHRAVMPGVLILEALAQAAGVLAFRTAGVIPNESTRFFFVGIDNARFRRPVLPGDTLKVHVTSLRHRGNVWKFEGQAKVDGKLCAEATYAAMIMGD